MNIFLEHWNHFLYVLIKVYALVVDTNNKKYRNIYVTKLFSVKITMITVAYNTFQDFPRWLSW